MVALILAMQAQAPFFELPAWSQYIQKVQAAYAVEVRWTKRMAPESTVFHGQDSPTTVKFVLVFRKPESVVLEEPGASKTVWNGSKGVFLDLRKKTWKALNTRPKFEEATWLFLPGVTPPMESARLPGKASSQEVDGVRWNTVAFDLNQIDAHSRYEYTFSDRNKLLGFVRMTHRGMMDWKGVIEYRIQMFDVGRMAASSEFSVEPPKGFTEGKPTSRTDR